MPLQIEVSGCLCTMYDMLVNVAKPSLLNEFVLVKSAATNESVLVKIAATSWGIRLVKGSGALISIGHTKTYAHRSVDCWGLFGGCSHFHLG